MSIGKFFLKHAASFFKMDEAYDYFQLIQKVGQPSSVDMPPDLLPMAGKMFTRAAANQLAFQISRDWVLPFWAQRQFTPGDPAFIPRMSWTSFNVTHRNWTAVGNLGADREVTVDPRALVTPWFEAWSLDIWLDIDGEKFFPSQAPDDAVTQKALYNLPIIETTFRHPKVELVHETFAGKEKGKDLVLLSAHVKNLTDDELPVKLYLSIRPYNPEGVFPVRSICYSSPEGFIINGKSGIGCKTVPDGVYCCDFRTGDCSHFLDEYPDTRSVTDEVGLASAFAEFGLTLKAGEEKKREFVATTRPQRPVDRIGLVWVSTNLESQRTKTRLDWQHRVESGMTISVPDPLVQTAFETNKTYLNLMDDGSYITPGVSLYHHYWFRDSAYMVAALDKMGYADQAREKLQNYPSRQRNDGFFLSQDGEWDSNGEAIWTLVEHFRMTGDRRFLEQVYGVISRGAQWIHEKTAETKKDDGPHAGLLPAGFSAEHFGPNDYFYWDDFWAIAGLRDAAFAAGIIGHTEDRRRFELYRRELWETVQKSLASVENRIGEKVMTASPYRRFDAGAIGTVCVVHPLRLMPYADPLVVNTAESLYSRCFYEKGFFQDMIHSGINTYLSLHVAQIFAAQGDPRAWEIADYVLSLTSSTFTWPEAVNVNTGGGAMGDGLHGWAAADFLLFIRNCLLQESEDGLVLFPCIPDRWRKWGKTVTVKNAPTHFGTVDLSLEFRKDHTLIRIDPKWRRVPAFLRIGLPFDNDGILVDGMACELENGEVIIDPTARRIQIGAST